MSGKSLVMALLFLSNILIIGQGNAMELRKIPWLSELEKERSTLTTDQLIEKYQKQKLEQCPISESACLLAEAKLIFCVMGSRKGVQQYQHALDSLLRLEHLSEYPAIEAVLNYSKSKTLMLRNAEDFLKYNALAIERFKNQDRAYFFSATLERSGILEMKDQLEDAATVYRTILNEKDIPISALNQTYLGLANSFKEINKDSSEYYYQKAIALIPFLEDSIRISSTYRAYGSFKLVESNYEEAIQQFLLALNYLNGDKRNQMKRAQILLKIGNVFTMVPDFEKAEQYLKEGLAIGEELNYGFLLYDLHRVLALNYYKQGKFEDSKIYFDKTLEYAELKKDHRFILHSATYLGLLELRKGDLTNSKRYYSKAKSILKNVQMKSQIADFHAFEGKLSYAQKNFKSSSQSYQVTLEIANEISDLSRKQDALLGLGRAEKALGNHEQSLDYFLDFYEIEDSLNTVENYKNIQNLELKYKKAEQEKSIAALNAENNFKDIKIAKAMQEQRFYILGIGLLLLLLFALYRLFKIKSKHNHELDEKNKIIQKALTEKESLLGEIHHRVKNNLQIISSLLNLQSRHLEDQGAKDALQEGKSRVQSMGLIHQSLYQENNLSEVNMKSYIPNLCENLLATYKVNNDQINLSIEVDPIYLDVSKVIPIGLVLNELLTNALKYAFPNNEEGEINIEFKEEQNQYVLLVSDNGIGMNAGSQEGFGTRLIKTFTRKLDAKVQVVHTKGTSIEMRIPIHKSA